MPVRNNGYYNNPAFAQAASNLASLFEPPSGADAAGWATADAKRQEAQRLADFFSSAPTLDVDTYDRQGAALGVFAPTQGFGARNMDDATKRYGIDVGASTSLSSNAANNAAAYERQQLSGLQDFYKQPLSEGQIGPAVPSAVAERAFGMPGDIAQREGREKPLSETELKALILGGLPENEQRAAALGSTPVQEIIGDTGQPEIAWQADSIGKTPYDKPTGGLSVTTNPDGTVSVTQGGAKLTEADGKLINYSVTTEAMLPIMEEVGSELASLSGAAADKVPLLGNYAQSEKYQQARLAGERFTQAILRNESGAATPDAEIERYMDTFLPKPGDKPGTIRLKSYLRKVAVEALKGGMSKAARLAQIDAALASGVPADFGVTDVTGAPAAPAPAAPAPAAGAAPPAAGAVDYKTYFGAQ